MIILCKENAEKRYDIGNFESYNEVRRMYEGEINK